jgi:hypothetical protein
MKGDDMSIRSVFLTTALAVLFSSTLASQARAGEVLYDASGFLQGTESFVESFNLPSAGTLTVTLSNVDWLAPLASLNLLVSSPNGKLGPEMGAGTSTFAVQSGEVSAQWFGTAQGPLNTGVYAVRIEFQPAAGIPVPLPTSLVLLLSGLVLLSWQRRRKGAGDARDVRTV